MYYQGQDLYDSKAVRDKQIVRILGKVRLNRDELVEILVLVFNVHYLLSGGCVVETYWRVVFTFGFLRCQHLQQQLICEWLADLQCCHPANSRMQRTFCTCWILCTSLVSIYMVFLSRISVFVFVFFPGNFIGIFFASRHTEDLLT